jgi:choline oxidase
MHAFDYIIVGGGSAGSIIAARLSENQKYTVLLLEAGGSDAGDPKALLMSRLEDQDASYDWGYDAETVAGSHNAIAYARAKMLGGCANHNDCAFLSPPSSDFARWENLGANGWGPDGVKSALARVKQMISIEPSPPGNELSRAFVEASKQLGLPECNFRNAVKVGTGWFPLNASGDTRQSSSVAYLHPILASRKNLRLLTKALVTKLRIENRKAVSVETDAGTFHARNEIILCAGSINTPQLLMLSGVGPAGHLRQHGIAVQQDLPGVGQNLVDHVAANIAFRLKRETPKWQRTPCEATALLQVDEDAEAPDVLFHFILRLREKYVGRNQFGGIEHGVKISPNVARPKSRGSLTLSGNSTHHKPNIKLNYLSDAEGYDRRILLAGLKFARRLAVSEALSRWLAEEVAPGVGIQTDEDMIAYMLETCETVYHPSGTCRMGDSFDRMTVVAPDLKVNGIDGLRIADASVFPDMVTVNINNTVMMVAEKAAEMLSSR